MQHPKENKDLMNAVDKYIQDNGYCLDCRAEFQWGIDCVGVFVDGDIVLNIDLPPMSNYTVSETEYTNRYLCLGKTVAS